MQHIGPYEIRGELGRGAMAVVWRGFDASVGREVAIKEPRIDDSLDAGTRLELTARFIREAKAAGQLNHPGIITIYNAEVMDDRPVIVMELVEGETLADLLRRGRLPLGAAIGIAEQLLDALAYAHERGVVHRDIKPDNVFVTDDGRVKLADFGIAHVGVGTQLTQAGTVMGTPGYMAPEQVRGEDVDARADIFSVGVMVYEVLTGTNPFAEGDAHPTTIMYRVLHEPLPDLRGALTAATEGLAATIAVATAKDAGARFASAGEMRSALLGEVAVAMPRPVPEGRRVGTIPIIAAVAAIGAVVVAGILWFTAPGATSVAGNPGTLSGDASTDAGATEEVAVSPSVEELQSAAVTLAEMRRAAEQGFSQLEIMDSEWAVSVPNSMQGSVSLDKGEVRRQMSVAQQALSSEDEMVSKAAAAIMSEGEVLVAFQEAVESFRSNGSMPYNLAAARYYDWVAQSYLSGDSLRIEYVKELVEFSDALPAGLDLWFVLQPDAGRPLLEVARDYHDSPGFSLTWEYDESLSSSGYLMSVPDACDQLWSDEFAFSSSRPWITAGGMHVFGNAGTGAGSLYWSDPHIVDPSGHPTQGGGDAAGVYYLVGENDLGALKDHLDEKLAVVPR